MTPKTPPFLWARHWAFGASEKKLIEFFKMFTWRFQRTRENGRLVLNFQDVWRGQTLGKQPFKTHMAMICCGTFSVIRRELAFELCGMRNFTKSNAKVQPAILTRLCTLSQSVFRLSSELSKWLQSPQVFYDALLFCLSILPRWDVGHFQHLRYVTTYWTM